MTAKKKPRTTVTLRAAAAWGVKGGIKCDAQAPNEVDGHKFLNSTRDSTGPKPGLLRAADHPELQQWAAKSTWVIGRGAGAVAMTSQKGKIVWYKEGQKTGRPSPRHPLEFEFEKELEPYFRSLAALGEMRGRHNSQLKHSVAKLVLSLAKQLSTQERRVKKSKFAGKIAGLLEVAGIKRTDHQVRVILRNSRRRSQP